MWSKDEVREFGVYVHYAAGLHLRTPISAYLDARMRTAIEEKALDWMDEASAVSLAGNPRRGHYLEQMADQLPELVSAVRHR